MFPRTFSFVILAIYSILLFFLFFCNIERCDKSLFLFCATTNFTMIIFYSFCECLYTSFDFAIRIFLSSVLYVKDNIISNSFYLVLKFYGSKKMCEDDKPDELYLPIMIATAQEYNIHRLQHNFHQLINNVHIHRSKKKNFFSLKRLSLKKVL